MSSNIIRILNNCTTYIVSVAQIMHEINLYIIMEYVAVEHMHL